MASIRPLALVTALLAVTLPPVPAAASREAPMAPADGADLYVHLGDGAVRALASRKVVYRLVVGNAGTEAAPGSRVQVVPAPELEDLSWRCRGESGGHCVSGGSSSSGAAEAAGPIDLEVDLPPDGAVVVTLRAIVAPSADGVLVTSARVSPPEGVVDSRPLDNAAVDTDTIVRPFEVTKSVTGSLTAGEPIRYRITIENRTAIPQLDNPGPELSDDLPPEIEVVRVTASSGIATLDTAGRRLEWNGTVGPFEVVTLDLVGTVRPNTGGREVVNQGRLHFALVLDASRDTLGAGATNDGLAFSQDPVTGGPTIFRVAGGPLDVPAIDALGLLLLAALLGALAIALLGRLP